MSRGRPAQPGVRRHGPALASALLLACLAGLALLAPQTSLEALQGQFETAPQEARAQGSAATVNAHGFAPGAMTEKAPAATARLEQAAPAAPKSEAPTPVASSAAPPYRFMGRLAANEGETLVVLFGRGRVITLLGPGPVDDEYSVEALFDDYLVLRHRPSGSGSWVPLTQHPKPGLPPQDPELQARD